MGGGSPLLEQILDSLAAQIGLRTDTAEGGIVHVELMAEARAIHAIWKQNERSRQPVDRREDDGLSRGGRRSIGSPASGPQRSRASCSRDTAAQARAVDATARSCYEVCQTIPATRSSAS